MIDRAACTPAPQWLQDWRAQQLQTFLQQGFPGRRDENWKYTSIAPLLEKTFSLADSANDSLEPDISAHRMPESYYLVFIDGVWRPEYSEWDGLPKTVLLTDCAEAVIRYPDRYQQAITACAPSNLSSFYSLNGALNRDGLFLAIPDHVELTKPIHVCYLTTGDAVMHHPRHLIHLGAHSAVSLLEEYTGVDRRCYFNNIVTHISVSANARLNYYKLQAESTHAFHIAHTIIDQAGDSQVRTGHIAIGSRLNRDDLQFGLQQPGASCELAGFYYPQSHQHLDFHTRIDHQSSRTRSRQYYKGIIAGEGRAVFNGKIVAHSQVKQVIAQQVNHNLLLSKSAEVDTKPELEVFADDVQCTHGATVGYLDDSALFYLRSRGIPERLAQQILMNGFAQEVFDRFPDPAIAEYVQQKIRREEQYVSE